MVKIRVPATSANVGVGFDCLGIALNLYTYFTFEETSEFKITGTDLKFQNKRNLVYTSFMKTLEILGKTVQEIAIHMDSNVPVSRGLGSSATCVVGGVLGAYALTNTPIDKKKILDICTAIEGHPDNVAPAIYGGLIASYQSEDEVYSVSYNIDERFLFLAMIPDFETRTKDARKVLPDVLPYATAVRNSAKLSVVLKGFETYDINILKNAMKDEIHEPYRKALIHEYQQVKELCETIESVCFYISGSGSTLMNVIEHEALVPAFEKELSKLTHKWQCVLLKTDKEGACIC
ncbi:MULTISPECIES: homoserine kinase [unclassified Breznakia]|uniref:homoserine kinase n=1 Tax=unclassified Breznakia TaxID=2623764 RepID=UPI0024063299|nr:MULTISPECIES: homoserine kinase [unclassified Breznakia]MDF9837632.1 homoserine kinase [Breznakia sp. PFB2-8]MDF9859496.1 homoserine kinase [Breznakia sp. PH5-24]